MTTINNAFQAVCSTAKAMSLAVLSLFTCCLLDSCSDNPTIINETSAQEYYNNIKGSYVGNIMIDNQPQRVTVRIDNDFSVSPIPLKPILRNIFTDAAELSEALAAAGEVTFRAPTDNITIMGTNVVLAMVPTDLEFTTTVKGKSYKVNVMMTSGAFVNRTTNELTLSINITEVLCNGNSFNALVHYTIDSATKQTNVE